MQQQQQRRKSGNESHEQVMDGSDIMKLVENEKVFSSFVDHKFQELDVDRDGKLSVGELNPAVEDIGSALGLPEQGTSPESDQIYSQVLQEFTHGGTQEKIGKSEFKEVLSDFLAGMADGLKRDPVVILRIDGSDLSGFVKTSAFEPEITSIFSEISSPEGPLKNHIIKAFEKLTVQQGMPPATDPWVMKNVVEPALASLGEDNLNRGASQETFVDAFKKVANNVVKILREKPAIVAHSQNTFDGSVIRRLFSNKFELDKALESALNGIPRDHHGKIPKEYLVKALDYLAPFAGLPPFGAVPQVDGIMMEALKLFDASDGKSVKAEEFKKLLTEVLGSMMLQLEGDPISVSINSLVHEPIASSSTLLQPST